jgi:hypothetical protein
VPWISYYRSCESSLPLCGRLAYLQYSIFVLNDRLRLMKITMFIKPLKRVNIINLMCHNKYKAIVAQMDMKTADVMYNQNRTTAISFSQ